MDSFISLQSHSNTFKLPFLYNWSPRKMTLQIILQPWTVNVDLGTLILFIFTILSSTISISPLNNIHQEASFSLTPMQTKQRRYARGLEGCRKRGWGNYQKERWKRVLKAKLSNQANFYGACLSLLQFSTLSSQFHHTFIATAMYLAFASSPIISLESLKLYQRVCLETTTRAFSPKLPINHKAEKHLYLKPRIQLHYFPERLLFSFHNSKGC